MPEEPRKPTVLTARSSVLIEAPPEMTDSVRAVLDGSYDSGCFGENLTILDIGANVGAFSIWANMRWPGSTIHSYESHPGTFAILGRNVAALPNVRPVNAAVYPTEARTLPIAGRYDGDGEAGIVSVIAEMFDELALPQSFEVKALHPRELPRAEIVKIDVEGAELEVLRELDVSDTELIVLEYHRDASRNAIKSFFAAEFETLLEEEFPWDELLGIGTNYRADLHGDHWGHLFLVRRNLRTLRRLEAPRRPSTEAEAYQDSDDDDDDEEIYDFGDGDSDYGFPDEPTKSKAVAAPPASSPSPQTPPASRTFVERAFERLGQLTSRKG